MLDTITEEAVLEEGFVETDEGIILTEKMGEKKFISKDYFDYNVNNLAHFLTENITERWVVDCLRSPERSITSIDNILVVKSKKLNTDINSIPFFAVDLKLDYSIPFQYLGSERAEAYHNILTMSENINKLPDALYKFCSKAIDKGLYNLLYLVDRECMNLTSAEALKSSIIERFNTLINEPFTSKMLLLGSSYDSGTPGYNQQQCINESTKMNTWRVNHVARTGKILTNLYFMAVHSNIGLGFHPVYCLVIKDKRDLPFIKACALTNTEIPASMLKFYYYGSSGNISKLIQTSLIKPLADAGLEIEKDPAFLDSMFVNNVPPPFVKLEDKDKYYSELESSFLAYKRGDTDITGKSTKVKGRDINSLVLEALK